jgi:hypothetical protein
MGALGTISHSLGAGYVEARRNPVVTGHQAQVTDTELYVVRDISNASKETDQKGGSFGNNWEAGY